MSHPGTTPEASPAVTELDGVTIERLHPDHAHLVATLLDLRGHRHLIDLDPDPNTIATLLRTLSQQPWAMPLAAIRDGECIGIGTTALADVKSLNAAFLTMFVEPAQAHLASAMMVRHLFWTFPIRRLHVQIPDMDITREYADLLTTIGFEHEGRLVDHVHAAGRTFDVLTLGLLRPDFEQWCDANEPRLRLPATV